MKISAPECSSQFTDDYIREMMHLHIGAIALDETIEVKKTRKGFDIMKAGILKTDEEHPRPLIYNEDFILSDYAENSTLWIVTRIKVKEKNDQTWIVQLVKCRVEHFVIFGKLVFTITSKISIISTEHVYSVCSLESELYFCSICYVGVLYIFEVIAKTSFFGKWQNAQP